MTPHGVRLIIMTWRYRWRWFLSTLVAGTGVLAVIALPQTSSISLREYVDYRFSDIEKRTTLALASMNERLDVMNEFRGTIDDQSKTFVVKSEIDQRMASIEEDIKSLRESRAETEGKATQNQVYVGWILAVIAIGISLYRRRDAEIRTIKAEK